MNLGVFRPAKYVFVDYFGLLRHVDAQEKILSQILVCSSVLYVTGGFSIYRVRSWDYFGVPRHFDAQEKISSQNLLCSLAFNVPGVFDPLNTLLGLFRCASTCWCSGEDSVANPSLQIGFECNWGGFRHAEYVFADYFGVPRHVDAQEKIPSQILVCSSVLNVSGGFSTRWVSFSGLFLCTSASWCQGDDFVANHSL